MSKSSRPTSVGRAVLKVSSLSASYGKMAVLRDVSLQVEENEIVAILGANGAGKTTLLKAIVGLIRINSGTIRFGEIDLAATPTERMASLGVSLVPEGRHIFTNMSVEENLLIGAFGRKRAEKEKLQGDLQFVFDLFPVLKERRKQRGGTLSGGEQQMLAIGRGMMAHPRLLLLDEPSLGLAPLVVSEIFAAFQRLRNSGITILLVEQNSQVALKVAHRGYVLQTGQVTLSDTSESLLRNEAIRSMYLGATVEE